MVDMSEGLEGRVFLAVVPDGEIGRILNCLDQLSVEV
jgi:hypothetical protein